MKKIKINWSYKYTSSNLERIDNFTIPSLPNQEYVLSYIKVFLQIFLYNSGVFFKRVLHHILSLFLGSRIIEGIIHNTNPNYKYLEITPLD